jgi:hypothetical protein
MLQISQQISSLASDTLSPTTQDGLITDPKIRLELELKLSDVRFEVFTAVTTKN